MPKISSQSSGKNSQQTRQDENVRDANEKAIRFLARFADIILEIESIRGIRIERTKDAVSRVNSEMTGTPRAII